MELRKSISDVSDQLRNLRDELVDINENATTVISITEQTECGCCGIKEECTSEYVRQVKFSHLGNWVCGLCSEAVKETLVRSPKLAMQGAVNSHRRFCQEFNSSRLNPKLSLASAMRAIARKSSVHRMMPKNNGDFSPHMIGSSNSSSSMAMRLARTSSCVSRVNG